MPSLYRALHLCLSIMNPLTGDWQGFNTVKQACFLSPDFQRWWKSGWRHHISWLNRCNGWIPATMMVAHTHIHIYVMHMHRVHQSRDALCGFLRHTEDEWAKIPHCSHRHAKWNHLTSVQLNWTEQQSRNGLNTIFQLASIVHLYCYVWVDIHTHAHTSSKCNLNIIAPEGSNTPVSFSLEEGNSTDKVIGWSETENDKCVSSSAQRRWFMWWKGEAFLLVF